MEAGLKQELQAIRNALARYDQRSVITLIAALQLAPENAWFTPLLEALAHASASLPDHEGLPEFTPSDLVALLSDAPHLDTFCLQPNGPFTESVPFFGGSFLVCTAGVAERPFAARHVAAALFLGPEPLMEQLEAEAAHFLVWASLSLSDTVATRAGLERNMAPSSSQPEHLFIPDSERLARLKSAVSFVASCQQPKVISSDGLGALTIVTGEVSVDDYLQNSPILFARPIVRVGDVLVVALPSMIWSAALTELIRRLAVQVSAAVLASRFHHAVRDTVYLALRLFHLTPINLPLPACPGVPTSSERCFAMDADKVLYTLLLTQPPQLEGDGVFGEWDTSGLVNQALERIRVVVPAIRHHMPVGGEVFCLLLFQEWMASTYQLVRVVADPGEAPILVLPVHDLETLSWLEDSDPLSLWKFAQVSREIVSQRPFYVEGPLDEFDLYRRMGHSYYLPDRARTEPIVLESGGALTLRMEAVRRRDRHGAPAWVPGLHIDVVRAFNSVSAPVYLPLWPQGIARCIEGLPAPVWIVAGEEADGFPMLSELSERFVDALGYWCWQLTPLLAPALAEDVPLVIRVELEADPGWWETETRESRTAGLDAITTDSELETRTLVVRMGVGATSLFLRSENSGERDWLRVVLQGVRAFCPEERQDLLCDEAIDRMLEALVPLGRKKYLVLLPLNNAPVLDGRGLPEYRLLQDADRFAVDYEIGYYLMADQKRSPGPIPSEAQAKVLNDVVGFLYGDVRRRVAQLRSDHLVPNLMLLYEAIVHEKAQLTFFLPARLACFEQDPTTVQHLMARLPRLNASALAARFLIEYVAAQPPRGTEPLSMSRYDRLIALANALVEKGFEGDLAWNKVVDLHLEILPIGVLQVDHQAYRRAQERFASRVTGELTANSSDQFDRVWRDEGTGGTAEAWAAATMGGLLADMVTLLGYVGGIGDDMSPGLAALPLDVLRAQLRERTGWTEDRVEAALSRLVLGPRADFLCPPEPFQRYDVYPWRYGRGLSYIRRPLVLRETPAGPEVLWGGRHIYESQQYLWMMFRTGRLDELSIETTRRMGRYRDQEGYEFNREVAELLERETDLAVRREVWKIGRHSLQQFGDLDVVAVDSRRRVVWIIECKNIARARTPYELHAELQALFHGSQKKKSHLEKVERRLVWLRGHWREFLAFLNLDPAVPWALEPLFVVSEELLAPHLWPSPIPVVSYDQLADNCRRSDLRLDTGGSPCSGGS